jgi:hypothetical protein
VGRSCLELGEQELGEGPVVVVGERRSDGLPQQLPWHGSQGIAAARAWAVERAVARE